MAQEHLAWKDVPQKKNKRARHTYDLIPTPILIVRMSPRQIRKMVLWHLGW
jgi:hypothetical protein